MIIGDYNDSNYGILARLFSSRAVGQILDFFLDHKEFDYSLEKCQVSKEINSYITVGKLAKQICID